VGFRLFVARGGGGGVLLRCVGLLASGGFNYMFYHV